MPDYQFEEEFHAVGLRPVAGIDEAGRGPLAGPVTAAAVVLPEGFAWEGLDDSKKLTARKREALHSRLLSDPAVHTACVHVEPNEIDRIDILRATWRAMRLAFARLPIEAAAALIDGRSVEGFPAPYRAVVKGDSRSLSIAAASVIAKVERDRIMDRYEREFPGYGFGTHKGYGTIKHREALLRLGPCPIHRRSFAPVARVENARRGT